MGKNPPASPRHPITDLTSDEAQKFFLKQESYCKIELPPYFCFKKLLDDVALAPLCIDSDRKKARKYEGLSYRIMDNKDGRYAWRPLEIIHPALYVSLLKKITEQHHWEFIRKWFRQFKETNKKVECLSIPVKSSTKEKDKTALIKQWWQAVEQKSIELALDYGFLIHTDIENCYPSIYTHSIAWALHTKEIAKEKQTDQSLIGNIIDNHIQDMRQGQTNGIPQGSVLMDFVAEMVLGYADIKLTEKLDSQKIRDYKILRYRDDYRIFIHHPPDGERILKFLTEVLIDLGLKLNSAKTKSSDEVIRSSIKIDKVDWLFRKQYGKNLQKSLLIIYDHSMKHPNSGSLNRAMEDYYKGLKNRNKLNSPLPLISIVVDIAYRNPRTYAIATAILSQLLSWLDADEKMNVIEKIKAKFCSIPNTGHLLIWLQRICYPFCKDMDFEEPFCRLIRDGGDLTLKNAIWENDWIASEKLRKIIDPSKVIDRDRLETMLPVVPIEEIQLFDADYF